MKYLNPLETPASDLLEHKKINLGCFSVLDLWCQSASYMPAAVMCT